MALAALIDLLTSLFSHCFHRKSKAEWMVQAEYTPNISHHVKINPEDEAMEEQKQLVSEIVISDSGLHSAWGGTV